MSISSNMNPFRPDFGISPLVWAGRQEVLDDYSLAVSVAGTFNRHMVISGARGTGKTALLNELEDLARSQGWVILRAFSHRDTTGTLSETTIPQALQELVSPTAARSITGASIAGVGSITTNVEKPDRPAPTLLTRLRELLDVVEPHGAGVAITVDEIQYTSIEELNILATAVQDLNRDERSISLLVAGLRPGIDELLTHPGTTFMRRAARYHLGPLTQADTTANLMATTENSSITFSEDAARVAAELIEGYPYFLQLVGALGWARARADESSDIRPEHILQVKDQAIRLLGSQVYAPEIRDLPPAQLNFLRATSRVMNEDHTAHIGDIAEELGRPQRSITDTRGKLIDRELIEAVGTGLLRFTLPHFRGYLDSPSDVRRIN